MFNTTLVALNICIENLPEGYRFSNTKYRITGENFSGLLHMKALKPRD